MYPPGVQTIWEMGWLGLDFMTCLHVPLTHTAPILPMYVIILLYQSSLKRKEYVTCGLGNSVSCSYCR